jgi:hypothetical protein
VFNGAFLVSRPLPAESWLALHWAEAHAELEQVPKCLTEVQELTRRATVTGVFGATIAARAPRLLRDQAWFLRALARLPQTQCHHDVALANLFAVRRPDGAPQTVAVDWESLGLGSIGAEIATLVFGTMRRVEFDAERAAELDRVVFDGYLAGLHEAGWTGDVRQARLGYVAAVALRWSVLVHTLRLLVDLGLRVGMAHHRRVAPDRLARPWVRLSEFLLGRADEARRLAAHSAPKG